ncbi:MAG: cell division ATP-binding protein FtsE [Candidatus Yanofskybacteria bacterium CG10_big_fil_rev_8_21_14_0_10_46_23]|uniref:Cell division ATP-binding protein FtsE n=1 Tax=Candidatus Yanofskybacteria bacterium CG10_big_fil_rev_8_21_14_0_10_46_23 TaxID=1975098 RepID=A0A2H0R3R0_9BACT|nr:MAG: cell division ATP-binding protein FtsE [Candidatus Yanofskybacteria bacterium CG10_big_fil_rev_8_21_14_0_10_46_23]
MIEFKQVTKTYDDEDYIALNDINLEIKKGEFVSLVGPSGAGKSTLMRMLTKESLPTFGQVIVDGVDLADLDKSDIPMLRRKIGMVFQDFKLLSNKTAFENVAFALEVSGVGEEEIAEDVPQLLSIVGLADKANHFPSQMSGGERQRLAIARALIHRPKIILADEPTGNLDLVNSYDVLKLLWKINELGTTIILATHDREIVNTVGRRVITIEKGAIVRDQQGAGRYII